MSVLLSRPGSCLLEILGPLVCRVSHGLALADRALLLTGAGFEDVRQERDSRM